MYTCMYVCTHWPKKTALTAGDYLRVHVDDRANGASLVPVGVSQGKVSVVFKLLQMHALRT
jgi:hypothetical protein